MEHIIKCAHRHYEKITRGEKKFELRINDRNFNVGDSVLLMETLNGIHTGESHAIKIRYILKQYRHGLQGGYCIFNW